MMKVNPHDLPDNLLLEKMIAEWHENQTQNGPVILAIAKELNSLFEFDRLNIQSMQTLEPKERIYNLICNRSTGRPHFANFSVSDLVDYFKRLDECFIVPVSTEIQQKQDQLFLTSFEQICQQSDQNWDKFQLFICITIENVLTHLISTQTEFLTYFSLITLLEASKLHEMGYTLLQSKKQILYPVPTIQ